MIITIDFETYYDKQYSLRKLGYYEYVNHMHFEVICMGVKIDDQPAQCLWSWLEIDDWVRENLELLKNAQILCHNTAFDGVILKRVLESRPSFVGHSATYPGFRPRLWMDTMLMARPLHGTTVGGSLDRLTQHYQLGQKGNALSETMGLRSGQFSEELKQELMAYCVQDVELTYKLFQVLKPQTLNTEMLLIDQTLRMALEPRLLFDVPKATALHAEIETSKNDRLIAVAKELAEDPAVAPLYVESVLDGAGPADTVRKLVGSPKAFAAMLTALGVEVPMKTSPSTGQPTYAFAKTDQGLTDLLEHPNPVVSSLVSVRLGAKSNIDQKRIEAFARASTRSGGKYYMPVPLAYCGAEQTWRWSGYGGVNFQNLPKKSGLRNLIIAPPGYTIVAADSKNIELRVNHALAGQHSSMQAFAEGRDLYCEFASILFEREITPENEKERFLGKLAHLSLGYGCGWEKFQHICRLSGVDLSDDEALRVVNLWRDTYDMIPAMWKQFDQAIKHIAKGDELQIDEAGLCSTAHEQILLRSGHYLNYRNLLRTSDGWVYTRKREEVTKLYGAKVVENVCQHIARNIIAHQWLMVANRWQKSGLDAQLVLQVHDELVALVRDDQLDQAKSDLKEIMSMSPSWWPEIPLGASVGHGKTYGDAK